MKGATQFAAPEQVAPALASLPLAQAKAVTETPPPPMPPPPEPDADASAHVGAAKAGGFASAYPKAVTK